MKTASSNQSSKILNNIHFILHKITDQQGEVGIAQAGILLQPLELRRSMASKEIIA